ncbi:Gp15 family bacteriophage protein [Ruminococcus sp.]|uniref:Gp15 family bacteriophage protein n=1 Tax=Ruminococcus sp. TaxID=41978 RepID=UPI003869F3D8
MAASTPDIGKLMKKAMWFIDGGDVHKSKKAPTKVIDWSYDESIIFPALNKVAGFETRAKDYLHWWTFLGYFSEVGDGLLSQVMNIRQKRAKGKKLEKWELDFYNEHKELVDIKEKLTPEEQAELDAEEDFINNIV